jgi:hypothetical protein
MKLRGYWLLLVLLYSSFSFGQGLNHAGKMLPYKVSVAPAAKGLFQDNTGSQAFATLDQFYSGELTDTRWSNGECKSGFTAWDLNESGSLLEITVDLSDNFPELTNIIQYFDGTRDLPSGWEVWAINNQGMYFKIGKGKYDTVLDMAGNPLYRVMWFGKARSGIDKLLFRISAPSQILLSSEIMINAQLPMVTVLKATTP